jgi:hypothetical protein
MGLTVLLVFVELGLYSKFPVTLSVRFLLYVGFPNEDSLYYTLLDTHKLVLLCFTCLSQNILNLNV